MRRFEQPYEPEDDSQREIMESGTKDARQEARKAKAIDYLAYMFYIMESKQTYEAENKTIRAWNSMSEQARHSYRRLARVALSEIESILNG